MAAAAECWLVEIELKRIQTYLFEVPRLPVMVGANALLGETLRGLWDGNNFSASVKSLPRLAQDCGSRWPDGVPNPNSAVTRDADVLASNGVWQDDVAAVAVRSGVLSRDGGHFKAVFTGEQSANAFIDAAWRLIVEKVPGILLDVRLAQLPPHGTTYGEPAEGEKKSPPGPAGASLLEVPQAEVCEWSGRGPASEPVEHPGETSLVSRSVHARWQRGQAFDRGATHDVLGIMRPTLLTALKFTGQPDAAFPSETEKLATRGYMAVVHIDGNSVGSRFGGYGEGAPAGDFFARWAHAEAFFHRMRVGVRKAAVEAIATIFTGKRTSDDKSMPLRLLMLGGDDLVLVCGAPYALPFVAEFAGRVRKTTADLPGAGANGEPGPLTVGAGVAVVQHSFPFYRAYKLAEELATSAKRLKANLAAADGNVVDWLVTSEAWHDDIEATRRRHCLTADGLVLSGKPYPVLPLSQENTRRSLQVMLGDAKRLAGLTREKKAARSQLQALARSLPRGRHTARFAADVLPDDLRKALEGSYLGGARDGPWQPVDGGKRHLTHLLDLLELYELEREAAPAAGGDHA